MLAGDAPCSCKHACHVSCGECWGQSELECTSCKAFAELYFGECLCQPGLYMSPQGECTSTEYAKYTEFVFNTCSDRYTNNGVEMVGDSYDMASRSPQPVFNRGVFFNNKTFFRINGLHLSSNFSMVTWIRSHDTGYATIFSTGVQYPSDNDLITSFTWRVSNS